MMLNLIATINQSHLVALSQRQYIALAMFNLAVIAI
jgi:hypothetical protein